MKTNNVFKLKSNIGRYVLQVIACVFIGLVLTLAISLCMGFHYRLVSTDSMQPSIMQGSLIIEGKASFDSLKVNDVITYTRVNESKIKYTHRIIDITDDGVIKVKGDNPEHTQIDDVTIDNYVGKVVMVLPRVKNFFDWVYNNMFLLLYVGVVIVGAYQILFL